MLNRDLDGTPVFGPEDLKVEYDADGVCQGLKVKDAIAATKVVVGDPSYFPEKTRREGKVIRAIALLPSPLPVRSSFRRLKSGARTIYICSAAVHRTKLHRQVVTSRSYPLTWRETARG